MALAVIWANRLIANDKLWIDVPPIRREAVKKELRSRVNTAEITPERYEEITGDVFAKQH